MGGGGGLQGTLSRGGGASGLDKSMRSMVNVRLVEVVYYRFS